MVLSIKKSGRLTYLYVLKAYRDDTSKSTIVYDDCTNYFFESEEEKGLKQYGVSKENRPNPIVQMGMFMDMEGMPLCRPTRAQTSPMLSTDPQASEQTYK